MTASKLDIILVSDETFRVAALRNAMKAAGLDARLTLRKPGHETAAALRRMRVSDDAPCLVLLDFATDSKIGRRLLKGVAFGSNRTSAVVAILTSSETEAILDAGEVDGGEATMFSPISLELLIQKLAGSGRRSVLKSMTILNEYGPVLVRAVDEDQIDDEALETA